MPFIEEEELDSCPYNNIAKINSNPDGDIQSNKGSDSSPNYCLSGDINSLNEARKNKEDNPGPIILPCHQLKDKSIDVEC